jgi:molybdenum cofactor cytidylyltransferase
MGERLGGLILAGGLSSRMGTPKALLRIGGETLAERWFRMLELHTPRVVMVTGAHDEEIRFGLPNRVERCICNKHYEQGMFSSLQTGLSALADCDAVMFTPVDYAAVKPATLANLLNHTGDVVKPRYEGHSGHPVLVRGAALAALLNAPQGANAKDILSHWEDPYLDVDDWGVAVDCDTPEQFEEIARRAAQA